MNYALTYQKLINKARSRARPLGYVEKHHVVPRALGGCDNKANLVHLTAREHFIAHMLLAKIHGGLMWSALLILKGGKHRYVNNRFFAIAREKAPVEREKAIKQKRLVDPVFNSHMQKVRSAATQNRIEGYQKVAGEEFTLRFNSDPEYAKTISNNRKKAKEASKNAIYLRDENRVRTVRVMRLAGRKYSEISEATGFFVSVISGILNGKQYIGVGETRHA